MTSHRSPILPTIALVLASWVGVAYVMPAASALREVGQTIGNEQADTYNNGGK